MHKSLFGLAACVALTGATFAQTPAPAAPQTPMIELKVGDAAPAFSLPGTDGKAHTLAQYKGRAVVLAWFPRAGTAG